MVFRGEPAFNMLKLEGSLLTVYLGKIVMKKIIILVALVQLITVSTSHAQELNNEMNNSLSFCPENDIYCQIIMREL
ncbi:hypothetical protein BCV39_04985 [Vibrio sp. 10N.286.55.E10]|uniref:Uncharacterized protein n=1 Tax=Vibrio lentus TaxID=136468 RepID=A0A1B9PUA9_9VIBR|nr:hypothetical protein A6E08_07680 [Vibrio lentus]PME31964.1 hypothetical protein BCV39_04985 [Vibrio sp. 10N.286.55.E10]PME37109.1 hypothetical protein BCV40_07265 [Vibrio sp. 10N.286.55.E12]PME65973.1 hypothetical protein BCV32_18390 [Vibrio sp. 10N.286.55.C11]PME49439.1 hypothetical protein BCV34_13880 [Vibrio lentus]